MSRAAVYSYSSDSALVWNTTIEWISKTCMKVVIEIHLRKFSSMTVHCNKDCRVKSYPVMRNHFATPRVIRITCAYSAAKPVTELTVLYSPPPECLFLEHFMVIFPHPTQYVAKATGVSSWQNHWCCPTRHNHGQCSAVALIIAPGNAPPVTKFWTILFVADSMQRTERYLKLGSPSHINDVSAADTHSQAMLTA
jgi:hypothetical protein